jgi:TPR repeat protein
LGRGAKRDYKEAMRWFRKAADQGEPDAQYHLGLMYEAGTGVPVDANEALRWFRLSAAQGFKEAREKVDEYAKLFPPQHEFSANKLPGLGVDQALEEMAREYADRPTDRSVRDDIAFPLNEEEYRDLGKRAVLLIAAVTHDPAELPLSRVYLRKDGKSVELQKIGSFLCRTAAGSPVERVLGPYRENAFYLLPISAYFQKADLLIDFARNRTGFKLIEFPEEVKVDLVEKDPDHDKETDQPVSIDVLNTMVLREYGVDLSQVKQK